MNVYWDLQNTGAPDAGNLQTHISAVSAAMNNFNSIGLAQALGNVSFAAVNRYGVPNFGYTGLESELFGTAQKTPLTQLVSDFFRLHPRAQPSAAKVEQICDGPSLMSLWNQYCAAMTGFLQNCTYHPHPKSPSGYIVRVGNQKQASADASTAAQIGGTMVGAGAGLIGAAAATPMILGTGAGAAFTAGALLTGGVTLVVVGVAVAIYFGWVWITAPDPKPGVPPDDPDFLGRGHILTAIA